MEIEQIKRNKEQLQKAIIKAINLKNEQIDEQYNQFLKSRNNDYQTKILNLYNSINNIEKFLNRYYEITSTDEYMYVTKTEALISNEDILEQLDQEELQKYLEEYSDYNLQEIATLIRFNKEIQLNKQHQNEAQKKAYIKSEKNSNSYNTLLQLELEELGVKSNIEDIIKNVTNNERIQEKNNITAKVNDAILAPDSINDFISNEMNIDCINLTKNEINEILENQVIPAPIYELSPEEISDYEKVQNSFNDLFLNIISIKIELETMKPEYLNKTTIHKLVKIKEELFTKNNNQSELNEILHTSYYLQNIYNKKIQLYSKKFDKIFYTALETLAQNIEIDDTDDLTLQLLYENEYQGSFYNPAIQSMYEKYCKEQDQSTKIKELEKETYMQNMAIERQSEDLRIKNSKLESLTKQVAEQENTIYSQKIKIFEQTQEIESQISTIEKQKQMLQSSQLEFQQSTKKIVDTEDEIKQLKNQIEDMQKQNSNQLLVIDELKNRNSFLENIIDKQKNFIASAMKKFDSIKNCVNTILPSLRQYSFIEKIAAKFSKRKYTVVNTQTDTIMNIVYSASQEYFKLDNSNKEEKNLNTNKAEENTDTKKAEENSNKNKVEKILNTNKAVENSNTNVISLKK